MKRLLIALLVLLNLSAFGQTTTTADRIVARQSLYVRDWWVDSIARDTNFLNKTRAVPTAETVRRFVEGRLQAFSPSGSGIDSVRLEGNTLKTYQGATPTTVADVAAYALTDPQAGDILVRSASGDWVNQRPDSIAVSGGGKAHFLFRPSDAALVVTYGGTTFTFKQSDTGSSTPPPVPLDAPGSFAATPSGQTGINLTWADVANETSYLLEVSDNGSSGWTTLSTPAQDAAAYSHTGLSAATTKYYRLSAVGDGTAYATSPYATANATTDAAAAAFTAANRMAFYKNSTMTRAGGLVTGWGNADGNTAYDFKTVSGYTSPIDATSDGLQITGTQNLFIDPTPLAVTTPTTVYVLLKKTAAGSILLPAEGGTYGLYFDAATMLFNPNNASYQTGSVGVADMADFKVLTIQWDGPGNAVKVYLDGVVQGSFTSNAVGTGTWDIYGLGGVGSDPYRGYIKGLAVFSAAHSAAEIATNAPLFKTEAEQ